MFVIWGDFCVLGFPTIFHVGTPKMIFFFIFQRTPAYENDYRPETIDSADPFCRHR